MASAMLRDAPSPARGPQLVTRRAPNAAQLERHNNRLTCATAHRATSQLSTPPSPHNCIASHCAAT
eukprot:12109475-Alexandrium_andersonii.AAC.1